MSDGTFLTAIKPASLNKLTADEVEVAYRATQISASVDQPLPLPQGSIITVGCNVAIQSVSKLHQLTFDPSNIAWVMDQLRILVRAFTFSTWATSRRVQKCT
jgi:hypothetical protein